MLTLILKPSNACNLRCQYCSLGDKSDVMTMSGQDMDRALDWFFAYAAKRKKKKVTIILHGGEPMLMPADQYDQSFERIQSRFSEIEVLFRIQTNGTILTEAYITLFHKYAFHVGISLDGLKQIHDRQRLDIAREPTYEQVVKNIQKLQAENIPVSILMVLTKLALEAGYDYLECLAAWDIPIKINPLLQWGEVLSHEELCLDPGDYGNYLIGVHRYILEYEMEICVSPLEELQQAVINGNTPRGCTFHGGCSKNFMCIDQKGDIYPCGRFADQHRYRLGNIRDGIVDAGRNIQECLGARRDYRLPGKCKKCKYIRLCNAGCSASTDKELGRPSVMCEDYRILFDYLYGEGLQQYKRYLLSKRQKIEGDLLRFGCGHEL